MALFFKEHYKMISIDVATLSLYNFFLNLLFIEYYSLIVKQN